MEKAERNLKNRMERAIEELTIRKEKLIEWEVYQKKVWIVSNCGEKLKANLRIEWKRVKAKEKAKEIEELSGKVAQF